MEQPESRSQEQPGAGATKGGNETKRVVGANTRQFHCSGQKVEAHPDDDGDDEDGEERRTKHRTGDRAAGGYEADAILPWMRPQSRTIGAMGDPLPSSQCLWGRVQTDLPYALSESSHSEFWGKISHGPPARTEFSEPGWSRKTEGIPVRNTGLMHETWI